MMKQLSIFLLVLILSSFTQNKKAKDYMADAKNGALMFRLVSNNNKIQALRKQGKLEELKELEVETMKEQQRWMDAFKTHYDYGKVYFFNDTDARKVAGGDLSDVVFDADHQPVVFNGPFIVAGFGHTPTMNQHGVLIIGPTMEELPKKFPDFIAQYNSIHVHKRSEAEMVIELNKQFHKFKL